MFGVALPRQSVGPTNTHQVERRRWRLPATRQIPTSVLFITSQDAHDRYLLTANQFSETLTRLRYVETSTGSDVNDDTIRKNAVSLDTLLRHHLIRLDQTMTAPTPTPPPTCKEFDKISPEVCRYHRADIPSVFLDIFTLQGQLPSTQSRRHIPSLVAIPQIVTLARFAPELSGRHLLPQAFRNDKRRLVWVLVHPPLQDGEADVQPHVVLRCGDECESENKTETNRGAQAHVARTTRFLSLFPSHRPRIHTCDSRLPRHWQDTMHAPPAYVTTAAWKQRCCSRYATPRVKNTNANARTARVSGPMGWPAPSSMDLSMSSTDPSPRSYMSIPCASPGTSNLCNAESDARQGYGYRRSGFETARGHYRCARFIRGSVSETAASATS